MGAEVVMLLSSLGADLSLCDCNGCTPMHWAAYKGDTMIMRLLVSPGIALCDSACRTTRLARPGTEPLRR